MGKVNYPVQDFFGEYREWVSNHANVLGVSYSEAEVDFLRPRRIPLPCGVFGEVSPQHLFILMQAHDHFNHGTYFGDLLPWQQTEMRKAVQVSALLFHENRIPNLDISQIQKLQLQLDRVGPV